MKLNAVCDDFRICLGFELETRLFQLLAQFFIVLDDAVVNNGNRLPRHVRVRIIFARGAMCRPARVRDAGCALERCFVERLLQFLHFAETANPLKGLAVQNRDTRRVVTAILEPAQALHQYRDDISLGNSTDDSTHGCALPESVID